MTAHIAPGMGRVSPSRIREIADIAFNTPGVLALHFGESNMPTPEPIVEAACNAIRSGATFYSENGGLPMLREALAETYQRLHGVGLEPLHEIMITASGVQALNVVIRCVLDPGDEAIVLTPNWPNASAIATMYSAVPREVPLAFDGVKYAVDFQAIEREITPRTRLLVVTSPSNPLGWVATEAEQQGLLELCRRRGLWLLADEVYERIYYRGPAAPSILRLCTRDDAVIVAQSFSKTFCMTGWRLGWVVARADLIQRAVPTNEFIVSHAPTMIQHAGLAALRLPETDLEEMRRVLKKRLLYCFERLRAHPALQVPEPEGAFYLFPKVDFTMLRGVSSSFELARELLAEKQVSVAPGAAFGNGGEGSIRLCCASDERVLEPAMDRVMGFLDGRMR